MRFWIKRVNPEVVKNAGTSLPSLETREDLVFPGDQRGLPWRPERSQGIWLTEGGSTPVERHGQCSVLWPGERLDTYKQKASTSCSGQPDLRLSGEEAWLRDRRY